MTSVFISSAQRDYGDVRAAVAEAVEALGMRPVMAERAAAAPRSPKGALLSSVRDADAMILIIGPRYGNATAGEISPTEDEFNEAVSVGKPVIVLVQNGDREAAQDAFLGRVRGNWPDGLLSKSFDNAQDVQMVAIRALRDLEEAEAGGELRPAAEARAAELAAGQQRHGFSGNGARARVALAPLNDAQLITDAALNQPRLGDELSSLSRAVGLAPQSLGIESSRSSAGLRLQVGQEHGRDSMTIEIDRLGAIVVEASVANPSDQLFAGVLVDPDALSHLISRTGSFVGQLWDLIDESQRISQACTAIGIDTQGIIVYGRATGSSLSTGGAGRLPSTVVAPTPALLARRADLASASVGDSLQAAVERVFRDAGAVSGI